MNETHNFVNDLVAKVPELKQLYAEHLEDNDGLLPHVFMGDLTRFVISAIANPEELGFSRQVASDILVRILEMLEAGMRSESEDVQELVAVSFLENLEPNEKYYESLKSLFGTSLAEQLKRMEDSAE